jgi:hypothetical protein
MRFEGSLDGYPLHLIGNREPNCVLHFKMDGAANEALVLQDKRACCIYTSPVLQHNCHADRRSWRQQQHESYTFS